MKNTKSITIALKKSFKFVGVFLLLLLFGFSLFQALFGEENKP